jgi:hypothetical protein
LQSTTVNILLLTIRLGIVAPKRKHGSCYKASLFGVRQRLAVASQSLIVTTQEAQQPGRWQEKLSTIRKG